MIYDLCCLGLNAFALFILPLSVFQNVGGCGSFTMKEDIWNP